jgi:hypothetical protein
MDHAVFYTLKGWLWKFASTGRPLPTRKNAEHFTFRRFNRRISPDEYRRAVQETLVRLAESLPQTSRLGFHGSNQGYNMAKNLTLPPGIGSYVHVLAPKADLKGNMKYSISILIPKSRDKELEPLRAAAIEVATTKWGTKGPAMLAAARNPLIIDGDKIVDGDGKPDASTKGMWVIRSRADRKPGIVGPNPKEEMFFDDQNCYSGCIFRITGGLFAYEAEGNRGVSFGLNNVQVCRTGTRLDGRKAAADDFTEWKDPAADPMG